MWCNFYRYFFPIQGVQMGLTVFLKGQKQAPYGHISLGLLPLHQDLISSSLSSFPLGFVGLEPSFRSLPRRSFFQNGWLVMLLTPSNICYVVLQNSFLQFRQSFGKFSYIAIASFRTSSSSSHIPWTSTALILTIVVSINFEQSHSISYTCTQF